MAIAAKDRLAATYAIGITGNAGPTAEPGGQPVGKVYISLATPQGVQTEELQMRGVRGDIQRRAEQVALGMLRDALA